MNQIHLSTISRTSKRIAYRLFLLLMTYMPFSSVAMAAESKRSNLLGESQQDRLRAKLQNLRDLLLPANTSRATIEQSRARFQRLHPELSGADVDLEFQKALLVLKQSGLLTVDESNVISGPPSRGGLM